MPYPWYGVVTGDDIEQGDILEACPVFLPPEDLAEGMLAETSEPRFEWEERDVIVMSQSCDMVKGREKISEVLLCPVWKRSELTEGHLATNRGMEDARRGNLPSYQVLARVAYPISSERFGL